MHVAGSTVMGHGYQKISNERYQSYLGRLQGILAFTSFDNGPTSFMGRWTEMNIHGNWYDNGVVRFIPLVNTIM